MRTPCPQRCNLLAPFGAEKLLLPALPIYDKLTPDLLKAFARSGGWHLVLGEGGKAESVVDGSQLRTRIIDGGTVWYAVQISFLPLPLEGGREYTVTFKARADRAQLMVLDVAQVGTWYSYSSRLEFNLTREWQTYNAMFAMGSAPSEPNARFEFNLGGCGSNEVFFDDVSVFENRWSTVQK